MLELSGDVNLKVVSLADRLILALLGDLIRSPPEKRYYASPYLPDAISDNSNNNINRKWSERTSVKLV